MLYRTMQPEYKSAKYLSVVKCVSNRRLISRFRAGCGRWADGGHLDRTDRLCQVCKSMDCVKDAQHFVSDCPTFSHSISQHLELALCLCVNPMHVVVSLGNALHVGSKFCLYELTELNLLSVESHPPPRTLNTLVDWLFLCLFIHLLHICPIILLKR